MNAATVLISRAEAAFAYRPSVVVSISVIALSYVLVFALRRYAIASVMLDHPNERSSHKKPIPRGGGAGVVAATLIGYLATASAAGFEWRTLLAIAAVLPTALAGWIDDRNSLPVWPRLAAHVASALFFMPLVAGSTTFSAVDVVLGVSAIVVTVSAINVVNFMDGIDGLVGLQAVVFGVHLALLGEHSPGGTLGLCLAAAAAGFLIWNWPPAKIFLGDVGSGALAVLGVAGGLLVWVTGTSAFLAIFLPLFPIFLDAAVTVLRRARDGAPLTEPHRSHLYQRLANRRGWGHARVSLMYGALAALASAVVVLAPVGLMAVMGVGYVVVVLILGLIVEHSIRSKKTFTVDTSHDG